MENLNQKIYSVSEINNYVKNIIESSFEEYIIVEGEISQMNVAQSGHIYITLKDKNSTVRCTLWSARVQKMEIYPEVGLKAIINCKVSFYEKNGSYQLDIIGIKSASTGEFHRIFEKLKIKLKDEGLFDKSSKKSLPEYPKTIAIITSLTGSVLQDILTIIKRRLPNIDIDIYNCNVQGNNCASSIIDRLITINKKNTSEAIIIARGGGSLEDLIGYNDEYLARQIYNSKIPIITAIGHETDTTIADLVADIRAATPSEAAEIISRTSVKDIFNNTSELLKSLQNNFNVYIKNLKYNLMEIKNIVEKNNPNNVINSHSQTVDIYRENLKSSLYSKIANLKDKKNFLKIKLKSLDPEVKIIELESNIKNRKENINNILEIILNNKKNILALKTNTINDINPLSILKKGYSVIYHKGKISKKTDDFKINDNIKIRVIDGNIFSEVRKVEKN